MGDIGGPGAVFNVTASVEDLRKTRDAVRQELNGFAAAVSESNAQILAEQAKMLGKQNDAEKAASIERINIYKKEALENRATVAQLRADIQKLTKEIGPVPLRVTLEGVNEEAIKTLRDEFGALLGPLNGVTGRISSIISLMKLMGQVGKESGEAAAAGQKTVQVSSATAQVAAELLTKSHQKAAEAAKLSGTEIQAATSKTQTFGQVAVQVAAQSTASSTALAKVASGSKEAQAASAGAAAASTAEAGALEKILGPAALVVTVLAAVAGSSFEAGKETAELARQYTLLGQRIGASGQDVQGLKLVAATSGVSIEEMVTALTRLSFALTGHGAGGGAGAGEGVSEGVSRARTAVEGLIGSVKQSDGTILTATQIFVKLADVFHQMPDGIEKTSLAIELFGRSGTQLIPALNRGSAAIQELMATADRLGITVEGQSQRFEAWEEAVAKAELSWQRYKQAVGDSGVFDIATKAIDLMTAAIERWGQTAGAAGLRYQQEFLKAAGQKIPGEPGLGLPAFTTESQERIQAMTKFLSQQVGPRGLGQIPTPIPEQLFPPGQAEKVEADLQAIANGVAKIEDPEQRVVAAQRQLNDLRNEMLANGKLELRDQGDLTAEFKAQAEAKERGALFAGGITPLLKLQEQIEKFDLKVKETDEDLKLPKSSRTLGQVNAEIAKLRGELEGISKKTLPTAAGTGVSTATLQAAVAGVPGAEQKLEHINKLEEERKTLILENQAEIKKQADEYGKLADEVVKLGERQQEETTKLLSGAAQLPIYTKAVYDLETEQKNLLGVFQQLATETVRTPAQIQAITTAYQNLMTAQEALQNSGKAVTESEAQYAAKVSDVKNQILALTVSLNDQNTTAAKAGQITGQIAVLTDQLSKLEKQHKDDLDALRQSQLSANAAWDSAFKTLSTLATGNKQLNDLLALLKENVTKLTQANKDAAEATKKSGEETTKDTESKTKLADASGRAAEQTARLQQELSQVGEKMKPLAAQIQETVGLIREQASEIQVLEQEYKRLDEAGVDTAKVSSQLNEAYRLQIENGKQLVAEQEEMKKSTITLANAWSDFKNIFDGFGGSMPKQVQQIEKAVEAVQKLAKQIDAYVAAHKAAQALTGAGFGATGRLGEGERTTGQTISGLSKSPQAQATEALTTATITDRASTDANTAATQQLNATMQAGAAGGTNLGGLIPGSPLPTAPGVPPEVFQNLPFPGEAAPVAAAGAPGGAGGPGGFLSSLFGGGGGAGGISGLAGPIAGGAGIGAALGGAIGGKTGQIGGAIAGGGIGLGLAGTAGLIPSVLGGIALAGPIGVIVGGLLVALGAIESAMDAQGKRIAALIKQSFEDAIKAFQSGGTTLTQTITQVLDLINETVKREAPVAGGGQQLQSLLPGLYQELAQLQQQARAAQQAFVEGLGNLRFPVGIQSTISTLQQLNDQITQFINSGGSAAEAAEFLARSLNAIQVSTANDLLNAEQSVVNLLLQEIQLRTQAAQVIHDEALQEQQIRNSGVVDRTRSVAQNQALQILQLRQQRDLQLKQINEQLAQTQAQIGDQQKLFGLTLNQNDLLKAQVDIQTQLTAQTEAQVLAEQQLLIALKALPPGATQVPLGGILTGVGGPIGIPGLPQPSGAATAPFDSSQFLAAIGAVGANGIAALARFLGSKGALPSTLTPAQEQGFIAFLQKQTGAQAQALVPTLQDILATELQQQQTLANQLPGGGSPALPYGAGGTVAGGPRAIITKAAAVGALASTEAASAGVPVVTSVSDALNATNIVPVAVVGGTLDSIGNLPSSSTALKADFRPVLGGVPGPGSGGGGTSGSSVRPPVIIGAPVPTPILTPVPPGGPVLPSPGPAPTAPSAPTGPSEVFTAPFLPVIQAPTSLVSGGGAALAAQLGYTLYGHDSFGAPVYINPSTGQLYNSLGEPLSPSTPVSPLISNAPAPSPITGPTPVTSPVGGGGAGPSPILTPYKPAPVPTSPIGPFSPGGGPEPIITPARGGPQGGYNLNIGGASSSGFFGDLAYKNISDTIAKALATFSSTAGAPSIGNVNVTIQGTTNMDSKAVQAAVTDGLLSAYNELRARRGAIPTGT